MPKAATILLFSLFALNLWGQDSPTDTLQNSPVRPIVIGEMEVPVEYALIKTLEPPSKANLKLFEYKTEGNFFIATYGFSPTYLVFYNLNTWQKASEFRIKGPVYLSESWFDKDNPDNYIFDNGKYFSKRVLDLNTGDISTLSWNAAWEKCDTCSDQSLTKLNTAQFTYRFYVVKNSSGRLDLFQSKHESTDKYLKYQLNAHSYWEPKSLGLIIGAHGISNNFIRIGIAHHLGTTTTSEAKPFGGFWLTYDQSTKRHNLRGFNLSFYAGATLGFGLNLNYYFEKNDSRLGAKPMIGFSMYRFTLTYGYNFNVAGNGIAGFQKNELALRYHLPILYKKRTRAYR